MNALDQLIDHWREKEGEVLRVKVNEREPYDVCSRDLVKRIVGHAIQATLDEAEIGYPMLRMIRASLEERIREKWTGERAVLVRFGELRSDWTEQPAARGAS